MYVASLNNFSAERFHACCDGKPNTLVVIKNSKDKVYGGYCPCSWESDQTGIYKKDPNLRSFVFNLTQGAFYPLSEPNYCI